MRINPVSIEHFCEKRKPAWVERLKKMPAPLAIEQRRAEHSEGFGG
jgi:hypothetical protein